MRSASSHSSARPFPSRVLVAGIVVFGAALMYLASSKCGLRRADRLFFVGTNAVFLVVVSEVLREGARRS